VDIVVQLQSDLARIMMRPDAALRTATAGSDDAARLVAALARFDADLSPQHPGATDPQLARWFVVHCGDRDAVSCEQLAAALREAGADAYVKPDAAPAGPPGVA
jgi:hypothetical protein